MHVGFMIFKKIIMISGIFFMGLFSAQADINKDVSSFEFEPLMGSKKSS